MNSTDMGFSPFPGSAYRLACNQSSEGSSGTYNGTACNQSWFNAATMGSTPKVFLCGLNWSDATDTIEVEVNLSPSADESPGTKSSIITFSALQVSNDLASSCN